MSQNRRDPEEAINNATARSSQFHSWISEPRAPERARIWFDWELVLLEFQFSKSDRVGGVAFNLTDQKFWSKVKDLWYVR